MKKFFAMLCVLALCAGLFGCTGSGVRSYTDPTADPEESAAVTDAAATDEPEATEEPETDYTYAYEKYDPDTLVMTIDGSPVYWSEYFYWLNDAVSVLTTYYGTVTDWDAATEFDETMTNQEYVKSYALDILRQYRAMEGKANELGVTVTDEDLEEFDSIWEENVEYFGSEEELQAQLDSIFLSKELYDYINNVSALYEHSFAEMYGESGEKVSDDEAVAYAADNGYMKVKHILFSTLDEEGNDLSDEEKAAKKTSAEEVLAELQACSDTDSLITLFDELMNEYSEDTGLSAYPDGYCFTEGEMVTEFEEASKALEDYGLSDIVESSFGYHIILRLPLSADDIPMSDGTNTLRYYAASYMFDSNLTSWIEETTVEYAEGFEELDLKTVY